jgi:hypothetical protein
MAAANNDFNDFMRFLSVGDPGAQAGIVDDFPRRRKPQPSPI